MSENAKPQRRRRPRTKQTYQHHKNAVNVTVYDPTGATVPAPIRQQIEESVLQVALSNKLLISIAYE